VSQVSSSFTLENWIDNSNWFDIKLLVYLNGGKFKKWINNHSYVEAIKDILVFLGIGLVFLGIAGTKLLHPGRNFGASKVQH
jgi:hypothetical protein